MANKRQLAHTPIVLASISVEPSRYTKVRPTKANSNSCKNRKELHNGGLSKGMYVEDMTKVT